MHHLADIIDTIFAELMALIDRTLGRAIDDTPACGLTALKASMCARSSRTPTTVRMPHGAPHLRAVHSSPKRPSTWNRVLQTRLHALRRRRRI
jgi:hypothetical protein